MHYNFNIALADILNFVKKMICRSWKALGFFTCIKGGHIGIVYRFKSLYVPQMRMTMDLLPIKRQMAAILDFSSPQP